MRRYARLALRDITVQKIPSLLLRETRMPDVLFNFADQNARLRIQTLCGCKIIQNAFAFAVDSDIRFSEYYSDL